MNPIDGLTVEELLDLEVEVINANHSIIDVKGYSVLVSYRSVIAVISPRGKVGLGPDWKYSPTTSKHRNRFLNSTTAQTQADLDCGEIELLQVES